MIVNLNIKTKLFDFEERVLIGWLVNTAREPANQNVHLGCQWYLELLINDKHEV